MRFVWSETATVFKGGGRRFFTINGAYRKAAKKALRSRERRKCPGHETGGAARDYTCDGSCWYADRRPEFYDGLVGRVARLMRKHDEKELSEGATATPCKNRPL